MSAATKLLVELTGRGIELQAHGDRIRYRPRSALTPELAERVKAQKAELLAFLGQHRAPEHAQGHQSHPATNATPGAATVGRPETRDHRDLCDAPHEPSLVERVESGYVNPGWTSQAWLDRLCQLAERCEALRPELAARYRTWAANVRKNRNEVV